jgi:hypothetical protein
MNLYVLRQTPADLHEGISVSVRVSGTSDLASIFGQDNEAMSNPFVTGEGGHIFFKGPSVVDIVFGGQGTAEDDAWNGGDSFIIEDVAFISPDYPQESQVVSGITYANTTMSGNLGAATGDGFESVRQAVEGWFLALWASRTPIRFSNVEGDGDGGDSDPDTYVALIINDAEGKAIAIGPDPVTLHTGVIQVLIITRKNLGTSNIRVLADSVYDIFNRKQISSVRCRVPYKAAELSYDDKYQITMNIPFKRYK